MIDRNPNVVIVASAFGVDAIRRDGHAAWAASAARAKANGFEIRRELFVEDTQASPQSLRELGEALRAVGVWPVYSTPAMLFAADGSLDLPALTQAIDEADALGARIVKLQLGGTEEGTSTDPATLDRLVTAAARSRARVVVENGQLTAGGTIRAFAALFEALKPYPRHLTMTFDTANWLWPGQDPSEAARSLAPYVSYVHCKTVTGEGARRFAVAPEPDDSAFAALLAQLPRDVPRGIEFPFDPEALESDAARRVAWLAAA